jgi:hypothetical protein
VFRLFRSAAAIASLTVCSLLFVMWARSYERIDIFTVLVTNTRTVTLNSGEGRLFVQSLYDEDAAWQFPPDRNWRYSCHATPHRMNRFVSPETRMQNEALGIGVMPPQPVFSFDRFVNQRLKSGWSFAVAYWVPALIAGVFAAALGIRRPFGFSLRTLMMATTWIAVVLGLVMALQR